MMTITELSNEWAAKRQEVCDDRDLGFIDSWTCADRLKALTAHYRPLVYPVCNGTTQHACGKPAGVFGQCQKCSDEVWDRTCGAAHESYLNHRAGI